MKLFVVLAMLVGAYYYFLLSTTNMMLNATQQLQERYQTVAAQADAVAAGQ